MRGYRADSNTPPTILTPTEQKGQPLSLPTCWIVPQALLNQTRTVFEEGEAFPIGKIQREKPLAMYVALLTGMFSRNLFPIEFSRNCLLEMQKQECCGRFERRE